MLGCVRKAFLANNDLTGRMSPFEDEHDKSEYS